MIKPLSMKNLYHLSKAELLALPLSELKFVLREIPFMKQIKKVEREIKEKGIRFKAHYWIGEEWFSPDGVPGISIPFYLFHPVLIKLQKEMVGEAEGSTASTFIKYLRHEYAHAIDNAYGLRRNRRRQKLFGLSSHPYPDMYDYKPESLDYVHHLPPHYAQAHPEEDWAETFAVWLHGKNLKKYNGTVAQKKLNLVDDIFTNLKSTPKYNPLIVDSIKESSLTLGEFYQQRRQQLFKYGPYYLRKKLKPYLEEQNPDKQTAYQTIKHNKQDIIAELSKHYSKASAQRYYQDILLATKNSSYFFNTSGKDLLQLLVSTTNHYVKNRRHRIVM